MVLTLLVLALLFFGLTIWFFIKNKKALAVTFGLIGFMALLLFFIVRAMYPHKVPF
jgi:hypothetical protein